MDRDTVRASIRALASNDKKRSKAARFRDVFDDVEIALAAGVPRSEIIEELSKNGLSMTLATFATTLKRVRDKRKKDGSKTTTVQAQKPPHKPEVSTPKNVEETTPEKPVENTYDPTAIDKIKQSTPNLRELAKLGKRKQS